MIASDIKNKSTNLSDPKTINSTGLDQEQSSHEVNGIDSANLDSLDNTNPSFVDDTFLANNTLKERKRKIMEHLNQSSNNFQYSSADHQKRNSKIKEHIKQSLS